MKPKIQNVISRESKSNFITKSELITRIKEGLQEVKLYKQGKIKFQSARDLLNELD